MCINVFDNADISISYISLVTLSLIFLNISTLIDTNVFCNLLIPPHFAIPPNSIVVDARFEIVTKEREGHSCVGMWQIAELPAGREPITEVEAPPRRTK